MWRTSVRMLVIAAVSQLLLAHQIVRAEESADPPGPTKEESPEIFSPLHALLGIDPTTGEFNRPKARPQPAAAESDNLADSHAPSVATETPSAQTPLAKDSPTSDATPLRASVLAGRLESLQEADRPEAALQAISELLQDANHDTLAQLARILPEALRDEPFFRQYLAIYWWLAVATAAILSLWSIGVVAVTLTDRWLRRGEENLSELDRRYHRTRFRRRLLQAALILALAGLVLAAGSSTEWWTSPAWLTIHLLGTLVLALWAWTLGVLIKRSARSYAQAVVRDLRRHHLELQQEVQQLRQRVASLRLSVGA